MIDGSGQAIVLITLLAVLERDAIERGEPSLLDKVLKPLQGKSEGNVVDFAMAKATGSGLEWRQDAIAMVLFAQNAANEIARPTQRTSE